MNFPFNVYLAAVASACVTTLVTMPLWRYWCLRRGLVDDPGQRKIHAAPVPLAGGWAVLCGMLIPLALAALFLKLKGAGLVNADPLDYGLHKRGLELGVIAFGAVGMTVLGWLDDKYELRPLPKFAGQLVIALLVALACKRITLFMPSVVFSYAITILWVLTVVNAFNFMDNMNGLCTGLGIIGSWYFAATAAVAGQYLVALLALLTCGALLGFLPHNFPKARSFLGDAGSHLVGYLLAVMAILPHFYTKQNPHPWAVLKPLLVLAVPLVDLAWVVILRWRRGQPFYVGDTNHLSHRLVRLGLSQTTAVLLIWLAAVVIGSVALL